MDLSGSGLQDVLSPYASSDTSLCVSLRLLLEEIPTFPTCDLGSRGRALFLCMPGSTADTCSSASTDSVMDSDDSLSYTVPIFGLTVILQTTR